MAPKQTISNKKHVAHLEQVRQQSLLIRNITIALIVAVVLMVSYGILSQTVFLPYRAVAVVNGDKISAKEFQTNVKLRRLDTINGYMMNLQYAQMFGVQDPFNDANFGPALQQALSSLQQPTVMGQQVVDSLIEDRLIRQEAARLGITVSADEVEAAIQEAYGFFASGTPVPSPEPTQPILPTINPTQLALVTVTPTASPYPTLEPTAVPTEDPNATATPSPEPTSDLTASELPTVTPTATPYTVDLYQKDFEASVSDLNGKIGFTEEDYRTFYESKLYRDKVLASVTADLTPFQEQVWAQHILVATEEEAQKVLELYLNGDDWSELALTFSLDTSNSAQGGDLGWFGHGVMVTEFEDAAFATGIGEVSQPVQTSFGFHLIRVLGHEERPVDASAFEQMKQKAFADWLKVARENAKITINDAFWQEIVPTTPELPQ